MKRKIFAAVAAVMMSVCLCACGNSFADKITQRINEAYEKLDTEGIFTAVSDVFANMIKKGTEAVINISSFDTEQIGNQIKESITSSFDGENPFVDLGVNVDRLNVSSDEAVVRATISFKIGSIGFKRNADIGLQNDGNSWTIKSFSFVNADETENSDAQSDAALAE